MAEGTIDNLNIQISADAQKATRAINSFVSSLKSINSALAKDISGMRKFSKEVGVMASAIKSLNSTKISMPDISNLGKIFRDLKNIDGGNAEKTAQGIRNIANSMSTLGSVNFNDTGINKTANALNRLFKVNLEGFNPTTFQSIIQSMSTLGNMPDVSSSVNRFVSSLSRLASAGENARITAQALPSLSSNLRRAVIDFSTVGAVSDGVNNFVQSLSKLANAGLKTEQTASGLGTLADKTLAFFNAMKNAPKISENTLRMTEALSRLASSGGKVTSATNGVSTSFTRLSGISSKAGNVVTNAANKITNSLRNVGTSSKHLNSAGNGFKRLLRQAMPFLSAFTVFNLGRQAIELSSNLTEVQNVVRVSFGSMEEYANNFAKTAMKQFGLSELAAKNYAGTMMAVLNSSGVERRTAAEMSTTLAGLAGDLASFYNISQDTAWERIMSGMAGEIEPLRRLGINLSVANLQAYALSQGITKSWQSMSQAEQVMLRYNYLMELTTAQQGDFARTSGKLCAA